METLFFYTVTERYVWFARESKYMFIQQWVLRTLGFYLFATTSRPAPGPTPASYPAGTGVFYSEAKAAEA